MLGSLCDHSTEFDLHGCANAFVPSAVVQKDIIVSYTLQLTFMLSLIIAT